MDTNSVFCEFMKTDITEDTNNNWSKKIVMWWDDSDTLFENVPKNAPATGNVKRQKKIFGGFMKVSHISSLDENKAIVQI